MHRPNRVGDTPIIKLTDSVLLDPWTQAQFDSKLTNEDVFRPVYKSAAVVGDHDSVSWHWPNSRNNVIMSQNSSVTFGLAVNGEHPSDLPLHVVYNASATVHTSSASSNVQCSVGIRFFLARATSSLSLWNAGGTPPLLANQNLFLLPTDQYDSVAGAQEGTSASDRQFTDASAKGQVIVMQEDDATFQNDPIALLCNITTSESASQIAIRSLVSSMALHVYRADIDTFDPTR